MIKNIRHPVTLCRQHDEKKSDLETDFETVNGCCLQFSLFNYLKKTSRYPQLCVEISLCRLLLCVQPCHICCRSAFVLEINISQVGDRVNQSDRIQPERT